MGIQVRLQGEPGACGHECGECLSGLRMHTEKQSYVTLDSLPLPQLTTLLSTPLLYRHTYKMLIHSSMQLLWGRQAKAIDCFSNATITIAQV